MAIRLCFLVLKCLALFPLAAQSPQSAARSFDDIFPGLPPAARGAAFSQAGYFRTYERANDAMQDAHVFQSGLCRGLADAALAVQPVVLVESILVLPGEEGGRTLLDVYNAISQVRDLRGRTYDSHRRGEIPLFEDATRIDAARRNAAIEDPPPASSVPQSETIYMRLRDANFGNTFYRAQMDLDGRGMRLSLTNNRSITYFMFPAIREERFVAQMYFEPIAEGILIYSIAGVDVSNFVASMIHIPSAISRRLAVIIGWAADGIAGQESES